MKFDVYEYTSKGGRDYNEDSMGSCYDENGGIFVVADGLGGHTLGDMASRKAVETIISGWDNSAADISEELNIRIEEANNAILSLQNEMKAVMKTTVAALAVCGNKAVCANSGDSRVYVIHRNEFAYCTNDHSVAFKKYKSGEITREQIAGDEDQSSLLRTLGGKDRYKPEIYSPNIEIGRGNAFFLCSDGAWEYLHDEEILIDFLKSETAQQWSELLMLRIMERIDGKNDNLSLMTIIVN
ncbi:MAG: serine/threonine-protein phosphatase [Eubacterium sp.]|nr:serine/threonine-protein phosphatase [Eubacterium sp.]